MLFTFMILLMEQLYIWNVITWSILVRKCRIRFWILFKQKKFTSMLMHNQNGITLIKLDANTYISMMVQLFLSYIEEWYILCPFFVQQK